VLGAGAARWGRGETRSAGRRKIKARWNSNAPEFAEARSRRRRSVLQLDERAVEGRTEANQATTLRASGRFVSTGSERARERSRKVTHSAQETGVRPLDIHLGFLPILGAEVVAEPVLVLGSEPGLLVEVDCATAGGGSVAQ